MMFGKSALVFASLFIPITGDVIGNSMWHFSSQGLNIFSPDGSNVLKTLPAESVCHNTTARGGGFQFRCDFYDVVSDGKKYVYAAVTRGIAKLDVFDIDTGDIVGSYPSCDTPRDLEYHPLRDEIWARCEGPDAAGSYMNVLSASGLTSDLVANITMKSDGLSSRGYSVIDNTLGDVGYTTDRDQPYLFKFDLGEKVVTDKIKLPSVNGGYEVAYSPVNRHIFIRSAVCCTCGFEGADKGPDCGRYGGDNVTITTGPWANPDILQSGQCGHRCDGIASVDNVGVFEYDTSSDSLVGQHLLQDNGAGDPYSSPDGKYVVLFGHNGGTTVRILKAGVPGEKSSVHADLKLGFNTSGVEDDNVYNDFAFVKIENKDIAVFGSSTENKLALVDLSVSPPKTSLITLSDKEKSDGYWERRQVEWAVGTNYVWVEGSEYDEVYVVDVVQKKLVKTISGVSTTRLVSVNNYEREQKAEMVKGMIEQARMSNMVQSKNVVVELESSTAKASDDSDGTLISAIALLLGFVAVGLGAMNLFLVQKVSKLANSPSPMEGTDNDDMLTLGSKEAV